jgi:hypothetical protein
LAAGDGEIQGQWRRERFNALGYPNPLKQGFPTEGLAVFFMNCHLTPYTSQGNKMAVQVANKRAAM